MYTPRMLAEDKSNERNNNYFEKEAEKIQQERNAALHKSITDAREHKCPFCKNFSLMRYCSSDSFSNAPVLSFDVKILLLEHYGNNPALHAHIYESHFDDVLKEIQETQDLKADYRQKLSTRINLKSINATGNNEVAYRELAVAYHEDPITLLKQLSSKIKEAELQHDFLKQVRQEFIEEQRQERNALSKGCKQMGIDYIKKREVRDNN